MRKIVNKTKINTPVKVMTILVFSRIFLPFIFSYINSTVLHPSNGGNGMTLKNAKLMFIEININIKNGNKLYMPILDASYLIARLIVIECPVNKLWILIKNWSIVWSKNAP